MLEGKAAFNYSVPRHALVAEVMGDGHSYLMWSKVDRSQRSVGNHEVSIMWEKHQNVIES